MRNIKLTIQYDGTDYSGWQTQANGRTVQEEIEKALFKVLGSRVKVKGAGRTDAGVHAAGQIANFKTNSNLNASSVKKALNSTLPRDIAISDAEEVLLAFDSQHDSSAKVYRYTIVNKDHPNPISRHYAAFVPYNLDLAAMRRGAGALIGRHDFKSFETAGSYKKDTKREIKRLKVTERGDFIYVDIEADGFLYNMARSIIGTLIDVGRGRIAASSVREILRSKDRGSAGPTAPAKGLCLMAVKY